MIIAIDGTFASGKGTLGQKLSAHYGLPYLDTGKLYRACAYLALQNNISVENGKAAALWAAKITPALLANTALKSGDIGAAASKVAVHIEVRAALLAYQKDFAAQTGGAILDGRDIGTVICPNAAVKLYVTAKREIRAQRRYEELLGYGETTDYETVLAQLKERDERDENRTEAPLKIAQDAHLLDTTDLSIDAAFDAATRLVDAVLSKKSG